jgi:hypothetical protein
MMLLGDAKKMTEHIVKRCDPYQAFQQIEQ